MNKKIITLIILILPFVMKAQVDFNEFCKKTFKFSTFYAAASGGTSIADEDVFNISTGVLDKNVVETPCDYNIALGIRKIARFGYENKANTFYDGTEKSWSDATTIGKISGLEFLFEMNIRRQEGVDYLDQNHFIRQVGDNYVLKGEYLEDGFADIRYFETSQRYRYKKNNKLSFNIGAAQRLSEPYGYEPLDEWLLSNGNLHYTFLAIEEGYSVEFDGYGGVEYFDEYGNSVATSTEVWEEVVIPQVLSDYAEKKRNELDRQMQQSLVVGFDYYHYSKKFWLHSWMNLMPWHYNDGGKFSYHNYNNNKQWYDYSGGLIFGYKINKHLGSFIEGKYNKYWNREWYDFKIGVNYVIF